MPFRGHQRNPRARPFGPACYAPLVEWDGRFGRVNLLAKKDKVQAESAESNQVPCKKDLAQAGHGLLDYSTY